MRETVGRNRGVLKIALSTSRKRAVFCGKLLILLTLRL
ncbi:hypothetical protein [Escherichia phage pEC-M2929-1AR.1]|nr:hypothetical protein [Escherichia phage pEC-M2929-1AR.1]